MIDYLLALKKKNPELQKVTKAALRGGSSEDHTSNNVPSTDIPINNSIVFASQNQLFMILKKMGGGAYGTVKRAKDLIHNLPVVAKIQKIDETIDYTQNVYQSSLIMGKCEQMKLQEKLERFKPEIERFVYSQLELEEEITKKLGRWHGSLFRTNQKGIKKKYLFIDHQSGFTLKSLLEKPIEDAEKNRIATEMLTEVQTLHRMGFLHLDLNLWNIMVHDKVTVIDFGCSAKMEKGIGGTQLIRGTHIPPENYEQNTCHASCDFNTKTDAFAAGMVLYSLYSAVQFDAYMDKTFEIYAEQYKNFYQKALTFCSLHQDTLPWATIVLQMINPSAEKRLEISQALEAFQSMSNKKKLAC